MPHNLKRLKGPDRKKVKDTKWLRKLCGEWAKQLRPKADPIKEWIKARKDYDHLSSDVSEPGGIISNRRMHYGRNEMERRCIKRLCSVNSRISSKKAGHYLNYCFTQTPVFFRIVRELLRWYTTYELSIIIETFQGVVRIPGYDYPTEKDNIFTVGGPSLVLQGIWNKFKKDIIIRRQTECHLRYYSSSAVWVSGPQKGTRVDGLLTETLQQTWFGFPDLEDVCNRMRDLDWIYCDDYVILKNRTINLG